ncbi:hypothetical protein A3C59_01725 [Candidatus Daviesbacteria bacterium RIFCSPHIGHO2_02_FULL_36_13]|uniref:Uncharacterized protein n=1 Tax=Candidatus Daviesbacteria bacterium RIFCSPHIGHO2_02_FULL_36_13 TaxID=1797768 RepID=A0A1F5JW81_9BACT|nr:MAG: hypothetical protein A3C59_01725 [Candidatus Daviesbacteria bacterium RIFCSPHIGHO2_02_FULL_36_13]
MEIDPGIRSLHYRVHIDNITPDLVKEVVAEGVIFERDPFSNLVEIVYDGTSLIFDKDVTQRGEMFAVAMDQYLLEKGFAMSPLRF